MYLTFEATTIFVLLLKPFFASCFENTVFIDKEIKKRHAYRNMVANPSGSLPRRNQEGEKILR
jgi:hypothetical protein